MNNRNMIGLCVYAVALSSAPAFAVNKCTGPDGVVTYQDAACTGAGQTIVIKPASGVASSSPAAPKAELPPTAPADPAHPATAPMPAPVQAKTPLESDADMCLAWYRPKLRDPLGAYHRNAKRENRVVHITVHATNGYGGYTTKEAACEIHGGKLNEAWTKTHARRGGWGVD